MPTELAPGVHDITLEEIDKRYRVFLVEHDRPILMDAGFERTVDTLFAGIEEIGVEPERLVITHADGDHIDGFDAVVDEYGVETWVPEQSDVSGLSNEPDHRYGDGDRIDPFVAVHAPGHEEDNHVLIDEDAGIAVMGDAVSGADQRGLPTGYFHLPPAVYSQDLNRAEESLARLIEFDFDVGLVYHGSSVLEAASEKLDRYVNFPGKPA